MRGYRSYFNVKNKTGNYRDAFEFDAFISYSTDDSSFAFEALKTEISMRNSSLRLCFHQEHFMPGTPIAENIVNAVHKSRKTVCFVSASYVESYWCMYEFNIALMEKIYSRENNNILVFVLMPSFDPLTVPLQMIEFTRTNSYLDVPKDDRDMAMFWTHLSETIFKE